MFLHSDDEYINQTVRMRRLILVFTGRAFQKVRFFYNAAQMDKNHCLLG